MIKLNSNEVCAPSKSKEGDSCLTLESLIKIAEAYNNDVAKKKGNPIPMIYEKKYLVTELYNRLKNVCKDQLCWIRQDFVRRLKDDDIEFNTFRPTGPCNSLKWLNTTDINKVIEQYYDLYHDFRFFGAIPIDFDDLPTMGIKNLDFEELYNNNIHRLGFVFNLDEHWKSGSHWVGMYANIKSHEIYFFDSYGIEPDERIEALMDRIAAYCKKKNGKKPIVKWNQVRHQFKNTECGVYSTNFILRLLKGETFENITNNITNDDNMSKCRKVYFNS